MVVKAVVEEAGWGENVWGGWIFTDPDLARTCLGGGWLLTLSGVCHFFFRSSASWSWSVMERLEKLPSCQSSQWESSLPSKFQSLSLSTVWGGSCPRPQPSDTTAG